MKKKKHEPSFWLTPRGLIVAYLYPGIILTLPYLTIWCGMSAGHLISWNLLMVVEIFLLSVIPTALSISLWPFFIITYITESGSFDEFFRYLLYGPAKVLNWPVEIF